MQATLCDNCQKPGATPQAMDGWRKVARFKLHTPEQADEPDGMQNPFASLFGPPKQTGAHICMDSDYDVCSDTCLIEFVQNGYKGVLDQFENLTPEDFADASTVAPPEDLPEP